MDKSKGFLYQFIPDKYMYLTNCKKIKYKNINLKSDYIINIIHELMLKYYFHKDDIIDKELKFNMWSLLLKSKYGMNYNYYIEYLIDNDFMFLCSNYYRNKKARTYSLIRENILNIKRVKVYDKILLKKNSKEYLKKTFLNFNNSPIPLNIREKLVNDLYDINIDVQNSLSYMNELKLNKKISYNKYWKNIMSIENIGLQNIFFKFDEYGRLHTNFTVLRKYIRQNYITIDNDKIDEIDLNNSQPLFLAVLIKKELSANELIDPEFNRYFQLVENGLIYEELMNKCDIIDRDEAKIMMYKVLFGINGDSRKYNRMFYNIFPKVYKFIKDYKNINNDYKTLSHSLQHLESNFIFNNVIKHIITKHPQIKLFTVHDSICYPSKYKETITNIFNYYKRKLLYSLDI